LAIIEALKCKSGLTQDAVRADLESHFQKLLGYGNSRIFFHLTYAYIDAGEVLAFSSPRRRRLAHQTSNTSAKRRFRTRTHGLRESLRVTTPTSAR
jgi:hypothetical protein